MFSNGGDTHERNACVNYGILEEINFFEAVRSIKHLVFWLPQQVVTEVKPTTEQLEDAKFAWRCVKHVKSNAITIAKNNKMLGMGSGHPNRVKSAQIAIEKAGEEVKGAAVASDAFFPFAWGDAVEDMCKAGAMACIVCSLDQERPLS